MAMRQCFAFLCFSACLFSAAQAQFAFNMGGTGADAAYLIDVDTAGNIFIVGQYSEGIDFDPGPGTAMLVEEDLTKIFLASYTPEGALRFAFAFKGGEITPTSMVVDGLGNVYIAGLFGGRVDFDPGPEVFDLVNQGFQAELFVASYNTNGELRFAYDLESVVYWMSPSVEVDNDNNFYLSGNALGSVDVDFGPEEVIVSGSRELPAFISSYDVDGNFRFVMPLELGGGSIGWLDFDGTDRIFVAGSFGGSVDFDPGPEVGAVDKLGANFFIGAYSTTGEFQHVFGFSRGAAELTDIAFDSAGNSYVSGVLASEVNFSSGDEPFKLSGIADAFLVSYDPEGTIRFGFSFDEPENTLEERFTYNTAIYDVFIGSEGDVFATGAYEGLIDFDMGDGTAELINEGTADFFLLQLANDGTYTAVKPMSVDNGVNWMVGVAGEGADIQLTGGFAGMLSFDIAGSPLTLESASATSGDVFLISFRSDQFESPFIVSPGRGGNTGLVTISLEQSFPIRNPELFSSTSSNVELICGGSAISSQAVIVDADGSGLIATFNLAGQATHTCNISIQGENGDPLVLLNGFEIVEGVEPRVWADISGREAIRRDRPQTFSIQYGNQGNVDAFLTPLSILLPNTVTWELKAEIGDIPLPDGVSPIVNPDEVPLGIPVGEDSTLIPLLLPVVRAGSSGSIEIVLQSSEAEDFTFEAWAGPSLLSQEVLATAFKSDPSTEGIGACLNDGLSVLLDVGAFVGSALAPGCSAAIRFALADVAHETVINAPLEHGINVNLWTVPEAAISILSYAGVTASCALDLSTSSLAFIKFALRVAAVGTATVDVASAVNSCSPFFRASKNIQVVGSFDPNEKAGASGMGAGRYISGFEPLRYTIYFENLEAATAPAQEVFITDTLDAEVFDFDKFQFGPVGWGVSNKVNLPNSLTDYTQRVDLNDGSGLALDISASLDKSTGVVRWVFRTIDPETGELPEDPFAGFLPPNRTSPEGEGFVNFTVQPNPSLTTDTQIANLASIVFDINEPIITNTWVNTIDKSLPNSSVHTLADAQPDSSFMVSWSGEDQGAGISNYNVYVSQDGAPFEPWLVNTPDTAAIFTADENSIYAFYSLARDSTGNLEEVPSSPDTQTAVAVYSEHPDVVQYETQLMQNYPNPFRRETNIEYEIGEPSQVLLELYDLLGRRITTIVDAYQAAGQYKVTLDARQLSSSAYMYRLKVNGFEETRKLIVQH